MTIIFRIDVLRDFFTSHRFIPKTGKVGISVHNNACLVNSLASDTDNDTFNITFWWMTFSNGTQKKLYLSNQDCVYSTYLNQTQRPYIHVWGVVGAMKEGRSWTDQPVQCWPVGA